MSYYYQKRNINLERFYIDGSFVFVSKPLYQLVKNVEPWIGFQHVIRLVKYNSIEDYELLLYFIATDILDIRYKDGYNNKYKIFLTLEDVIQLENNLKKMSSKLINELLSGSMSQNYVIKIKYDIRMIITGIIDHNGSPMIQIQLTNDTDPNNTFECIITPQKFTEMLLALTTAIRNWSAVINNAMYQFNYLGKAIKNINDNVNQLLQTIKIMQDTIKELKSEIDELKSKEFVTNDNQIVDNDKNRSIHQDVIIETEDLYPTNEIREDNEPTVSMSVDDIMSKVGDILNKQNDKDNYSPLPLSITDSLKDLYYYIKDHINGDIITFVNENKDHITRILKHHNLLDDNFIDADILNILYDLVDVFENPNTQMTPTKAHIKEVLNYE